MREKSVTSKALSLSVISCCVRVPDQCKLASNVVIMNPRRLFIARHPLNPSTECQLSKLKDQVELEHWGRVLKGPESSGWATPTLGTDADRQCAPEERGSCKRGCGCGCWWYYYLRSRWQRLESRGRNCQLSACRAFTIHRWTHR